MLASSATFMSSLGFGALNMEIGFLEKEDGQCKIAWSANVRIARSSCGEPPAAPPPPPGALPAACPPPSCCPSQLLDRRFGAASLPPFEPFGGKWVGA